MLSNKASLDLSLLNGFLALQSSDKIIDRIKPEKRSLPSIHWNFLRIKMTFTGSFSQAQKIF